MAAESGQPATTGFHGQPVIRGRADVDAALRETVAGGTATLQSATDEVLADGSLVVDIGRIISPAGQSKYVVAYQRQADGSLGSSSTRSAATVRSRRRAEPPTSPGHPPRS